MRGALILTLLLLLAQGSPAGAQQAIDTRQFGLLTPGMTAAQVTARLGPPAHVEALSPRLVTRGQSHPSTLHPETRQHQSVTVVISREIWHYPGTPGVPATRLHFEDGILVQKDRQR